MTVEAVVSWVSELPPAALPLFVFASALIEYVIPPYWGDMFVLLGFFLAAQGVLGPHGPQWIFAAAFLGSMAGALIAFRLGELYGLRVMRKVAFLSRRRRRGSRERVQRLLTRYGEPILVVNRFIPVVRAVCLYAAGALRLDFLRSMAFTGLANLIWVGLLASVGIFAGDTWEEIRAAFTRSSRQVALAILVAVAVGAVVAVALRHRRRRPR